MILNRISNFLILKAVLLALYFPDDSIFASCLKTTVEMLMFKRYFSVIYS